MNYRQIVIIFTVALMVLSPSIVGIFGGQDSVVASADVHTLPRERIRVYLTATGECREMDIEEYVSGVMLAEAPSVFDAEALKAVAVAVRSRAVVSLLREEPLTRHFSADVCDSHTHCMGYISLEEAVIRWGSERADVFYKTVEDAVFSTKGRVLLYGDEVADAVFHKSSEGATESAENAWGITVPYLVSVKEQCGAAEKSVRLTADELTQTLSDAGVVCGSAEEGMLITSVVNSSSGRVSYVEIGGRTVTGRRLREILGLPSTCFTAEYREGGYEFTSKGEGHGVGLSLEGANALAIEGADCEEILAHYYSRCHVAFFDRVGVNFGSISA